MVKTPSLQLHLSSYHSHSQNHKDLEFLLWCRAQDDPLTSGYYNYHFWGDELTFRASSKLHARNISCHGEQTGTMSPQVDFHSRSLLSADFVFGFGSFFGHGHFLPHHCAYPAARPHFPCGGRKISPQQHSASHLLRGSFSRKWVH